MAVIDAWVSEKDVELADDRQERLFETVSIVLVGKYTSLEDSYMSVVKALEHSAMRCARKLELHVRMVSDMLIIVG
jgi:CTP synthase (UTP-ammonia lyase)